MVGIDTEKVLATSSLGVAASTAESTLNLRSFEYGFIPGAYHIRIDTYGSRCKITVPQPKIGNQPSSVLTAMSNAPPTI